MKKKKGETLTDAYTHYVSALFEICKLLLSLIFAFGKTKTQKPGYVCFDASKEGYVRWC